MTVEKKMQKILNFTGPVVAALTPFDEQRQVNYSMVAPYIDHLRNIDVNGFYIFGTTGEGLLLRKEERFKLFHIWIEETRKFPSLAIFNLSTSCIEDVCEFAEYFDKQDVDGIALLPPCNYKPDTVDKLVQYISFVASFAPNTPILFYHFPLHSGVNLPLVPLVEKLLAKVPTFVGLKYTCQNIVELNDIFINFGKKIKILPGYGQSLLACSALGMDASIGAHFSAKNIVSSYRTILNFRQNVEQARINQENITKQILLIEKDELISSLKKIVKEESQGKVNLGICRIPWTSNQQEQEITNTR